MKQKFLIASLILLFLLASCSANSSESDEKIAMEVITLHVSPTLAHWLSKVSACAEPITDFGVYVEIRPPEDLTLDEADLILRLGEPQEDDPYITLLGTEKIVLIAGEEVPLSTISIESLQAIYAGQIKNWQDVPEIRDAGVEINQPIHAFSYPKGHELRKLFIKDILETNEMSQNIQVFSSLEVLQNGLEEYPFGIGYLLESQVPEGVQTMTITNFDSAVYYVLGVTGQGPEGALKQLLLCLQNSK